MAFTFKPQHNGAEPNWTCKVHVYDHPVRYCKGGQVIELKFENAWVEKFARERLVWISHTDRMVLISTKPLLRYKRHVIQDRGNRVLHNSRLGFRVLPETRSNHARLIRTSSSMWSVSLAPIPEAKLKLPAREKVEIVNLLEDALEMLRRY